MENWNEGQNVYDSEVGGATEKLGTWGDGRELGISGVENELGEMHD